MHLGRAGEPLGEPRENQNASVFPEIDIACVLLAILVDEKVFEPEALLVARGNNRCDAGTSDLESVNQFL
jgi:hypothetical protein